MSDDQEYLPPSYAVYPLLLEVFETSIEEADLTDLIDTVSDLYDSFSSQGFEKSFIHILRIIFTETKRTKDIQKMMSFVAECAVTLNSRFKPETSNESAEDIECMHPLLKNIFKIMEKWCEASCFTVRYRVCQILQMILTRIQDHDVGEIDADVYEKISNIVEKTRLDVNSHVRAYSVLLAKFFQDPSTVNDPVIEGLCWQLQYDPNAKVRQNIATILAACEESVDALTQRFLYDKNVGVRNAALMHICNRIGPRIYTTSQRILILNQCFNDPSELVRQNAENKLIPMWLKAYKDSLCKFLESIRVGSEVLDNFSFMPSLLRVLSKSVKISQILQEIDINMETYLPKGELTAEQVFLWHHFYELAQRNEKLVKYLPAADQLIEFILKQFQDSTSSTTIYNELALFLTEIIDNEEAEKCEKIFPVVFDTLQNPSISHEVVPYLVPLYLLYSPKDRIIKSDEMLEIIENLQKLIQFTTPDMEKQILQKVFAIASEVLTDETFLTNSIRNIKDNLILQHLNTEDPILKVHVICAFTLYCLLDSHEAQMSWSYFADVVHLPSTNVKHALLKGAFDLLKCYGSQIFAHGVENGNELFEDALSTFISEIQEDDSEERNIVVTGVLKLYVEHHTWSSSILSKIILLYFYPDEYSTQKKIEEFLNCYKEIKEEIECIQQSFLQVIDELYDAKKNSLYYNINIKDVVLKLIALSTQVENWEKIHPEQKFQDVLIVRLFKKFIKKPWRLSAADLYSICSSIIPKNLETLALMKQQVKVIIESLDSAGYQQKNPFSKKSIKSFSVYMKKLQVAIDKIPLSTPVSKSSPLEKRLFDTSTSLDSSSSEHDIRITEESTPESKRLHQTPKQKKTPLRGKTTTQKPRKKALDIVIEHNVSM